MRKITGIARYTFIEIFRNKVYYVLVLFAIVMLGSTLLLGALGGEQNRRMIIDCGLMSMETFSLIIAIFAAVTLVQEEMESRTLYLILTRPVARYQFVLGRYLGLVLLLGVTYLVMTLGLGLLLLTQHIYLDSNQLWSLFYSWEKIVVITAAAMAFSVFATSTISAISFTIFFWVMGHFSSELRFLAHKAASPILSFLFMTFYFIAPNFQAMNLRDFPAAAAAGTGWLWPSIGYGLTYTTVCLSMVVLLFRKKEF